MAFGDDGPGIVCWMTVEGEVICERVFEGSSTPEPVGLAKSSGGLSDKADAEFQEHLPKGNWGPNKVKLARRLLEVLAASDLPDDKISRRAGESVDSVRQLLAPVPPSILLFNYSTLPANVMGAYFLNKADLVRMQQMFKTFEHPKES